MKTFTSLGKDFFTLVGNQSFTLYGKDFFTSYWGAPPGDPFGAWYIENSKSVS